MGVRLLGIRKASFAANQASSKVVDIPKGYLAVYVREKITNKMKRFVIPISYLNQPSFQVLLNQVEEEFGYDHPMCSLTIPCKENEFLNVTSNLKLMVEEEFGYDHPMGGLTIPWSEDVFLGITSRLN
ncbi:auxin-induced protein X10A-like [Glycine soja]|uniref:auxin-induced protein X10A-like n=1 Tax=Glycine max TaxID=3847 RepID=UPI000E21B2EF|nr:auxin-induced protein X10A-like [Glycine max]XP_028193909.1 auxin-induced protein X10A-like [Glycine soja]|eukprot:XP_025980388.1 auxin-induced protein X10A-like [Glycine max]